MMREALISAISSFAGGRFHRKARRFLQGLSTDELQYIAEYLGTGVVEPGDTCAADGAASGGLSDREHKMILLLEYLSCCQFYSAVSFNSRIQMSR